MVHTKSCDLNIHDNISGYFRIINFFPYLFNNICIHFSLLSWKVNLVQTTVHESVTMNRACWWQNTLPMNSNRDLPFSLHSDKCTTRPRHTHTGCTAKGAVWSTKI